LNGLIGYTAQKTTLDQLSVSAQGFQNDAVPEITAKGADPTNFFQSATTSSVGFTGTGKQEETLLSYLARVEYNYDERYFLTAAFRTDGSSRFGPQNRYGSFPSVSAGWTLSNESFYHSWLGAGSTLRLRGSWGLTGNYNIPLYGYQQTVASPTGAVFGTGTIQTAFYPGPLKDQRLGWESTSQFNVGLDIGMFNNRLNLISNAYLSHSYNLLFNQPISAISGTTSILTNLRDSRIRNQGLEFQLDGRAVATQNFNLNLSGNISFNRNLVQDMGGANTITVAGAERSYITHITQEGQPVGMFYGYRVVGMVRQADVANIAADNAVYNAATQSFPAGYERKGPPRSTASTNPLRPGDLIFDDVNGDGVVNDADKQVIGSPYPKFTYGFALTASYKALDFNAGFNGVYGNQVLDGQDYYLYNMEGSGNQYADVANRYRSEDQPGDGRVYRASRGGTQSNSTRLSTFYLQSGSFLRCTNLTLGYNLPTGLLSKVRVSALRVYLNANNVFTLTKYKGYNPEVDYNNGLNLAPGVDYGKYPLARGYNVGVRLSF